MVTRAGAGVNFELGANSQAGQNTQTTMTGVPCAPAGVK